MAFGGLRQGARAQDMAEINMIPLIDVMLVLLVIFIITAPLLTHTVKVDLPQASSAVSAPDPAAVTLSIQADGSVYWDNEPVDPATLSARLRGAGALPKPPELQIRADGELAYKHVIQLMSDAARARLTRIGFVTDPRTPAPAQP